MSIEAIEKLLWQVTSSPEEAKRLRGDFTAYLQDFRIDKEERSMLTSWDVSALDQRGVNPLLLMSAYAAVNGMDKVGDYIMKINAPRSDVGAV